MCSVIAKNVRKLRAKKGLTQEELAFQAEIDRSYLSEIESGNKNISVIMLDRIASALEVKIVALFKGYKNN